MEGNADRAPDAMVGYAMTHLHGFDLAASDPLRPMLLHHGPPGSYFRSLADVRSELEAWRAACAAYDADPEAWTANRLAIARAFVEEERRDGVFKGHTES